MIILNYEDHGCVYALIDGELHYAPMYSDNTFDTEEFVNVQLDHIAEEDAELCKTIINQLKTK